MKTILINKLRLICIFFLCLVASLYAAQRMFVCIFTNTQRAWVLAVAHDQLANAAANGDPDETISARADRGRREGNKWGCVLCKWLDILDPGHCARAALLERKSVQRKLVQQEPANAGFFTPKGCVCKTTKL